MHKSLISKFFILLLVVGLLFAVAPTRQAEAADIPVACLGTDDTALLQGAITGATDGDVINVSGTCVLSANITVSKDVTLNGGGTAMIKVSGTGYRITMTTAGATLQGFDIEKTDKTGTQNIVQILANDITIQGNDFHGQFVIGDGEVSRALEIAGGLSGLVIDGNDFTGLRQPAYINGPTTGTISNNFTAGTKGWVVAGGNMTFSDNTWGTVANGNPNVYDIAILSGVGSSYYTDVPAMSAANNDAFIEDQRYSTPLLTPVYVDASVSTCTDCGTARMPYDTIQEGVDRVIPGGTVNVLAGNYASITANKAVTLLGPNAGIHPAVGKHPTEVVGTRGPEAVVGGELKPSADNVTVDGFKFLKAGTRQIDTYADANNFTMRNNIIEATVANATTAVMQFGGGSHLNMLFEFNLFMDEGDHTFYSGGGPFDGLTFQYNKFQSAGDSIFWTASPLVNGVIKGNEFDGETGTNYNTINIGQAGNLQLADNWFHDNVYTSVQVGIINGSITGNLFEKTYPYPGYGSRAIELWGGEWGTAVSTNVTVTGNKFYYNDIAGALVPSHGIRLRPPAVVGNPSIDASTIHLSCNEFYDGGARTDAFAIWHQGNQSTSVDADSNYWGSPTPDFTGKFSGPVSYVPYNTDDTCGTPVYPPVVNVTQGTGFNTIQPAINAANPGDVITVAAGTYNENLVINKSLTLTGAGAADTIVNGVAPTTDAGMLSIAADNVTISGFKFVGEGYKVIRINAPTTGVTFSNNTVVGPTITGANSWLLWESNYNALQTNMTVTGNTFIGNGQHHALYFNPTTENMTFTDNTITGTFEGGSVVVFDALTGTFNISDNDLTGVGGTPYGFMGTPGLTPGQMNALLAGNTWPAGAAVVGTDIRIPDTKLLMDPAEFVTTDTCASTTTYTVTVKVQNVTDLVAYYLNMTYDKDLITVTYVQNLTLAGAATPGNTWANGEIHFGWRPVTGAGDPVTHDGDVDLIKISFKATGLAGTSAFTILPSSALEEWPNSFGIPFEITGGASVNFGSIVTNTKSTVETTDDVSYCNLEVAVAQAAVAGGDTLRADANFTQNKTVNINKALTLDTNGKTISRTTGLDSSNVFLVQPGGDLTITGGGAITTNAGTAVNITGDATTLAKVTLEDATLYGPVFSVAIVGNTTATYQDTAYKSQFVMTGGHTNETVMVQGNGAEAEITGGTLTGATPIMGNGTANSGGTKITVGGTATVGSPTLGWAAIFHPQVGELNITGGTIQGNTGIEMAAGDLVVTGGTIEGYGACIEPVWTAADGSTNTGDAILILHQDGYGVGDAMNVTISGEPTIKSTNCYALREVTLTGGVDPIEPSTLNLAAISGGHFTGLPAAVSFTTVSDANLDLTAGDYSHDPIAFVYAPYGTYLNTDNRWYIAPLPVISSTNFDNQVTLGVETTFDLTITNSIPGTFDMVFTGYPSETQITYNGTTYYCVMAGTPAVCTITVPVTLTGVTPVTLPFAITVATGGSETPAASYPVAVTMHAPAPAYGTTGRDLDTLTATVPVTPGFTVSGTVTMQGRTTRADIPVFLTWNNTLGVTYGPHMDTDEQAVNFRLAVNYGGTYTVTTLQPRYLNITADLAKTISVTGDTTFANPLWLRAGNAIWQTAAGVYDNKIGVTDAQKVLDSWATTGMTDEYDNSGDVNFDGTVSIKDLTLVGGNMDLQSESSGQIEGYTYAYPDWQP